MIFDYIDTKKFNEIAGESFKFWLSTAKTDVGEIVDSIFHSLINWSLMVKE